MYQKQQEDRMNSSRVAFRLREQIDCFSGELSKGLPKTAQRFVREMIYGIQAKQSVMLTEVARALEEPIRFWKQSYDVELTPQRQLFWITALNVERREKSAKKLGELQWKYHLTIAAGSAMFLWTNRNASMRRTGPGAGCISWNTPGRSRLIKGTEQRALGFYFKRNEKDNKNSKQRREIWKRRQTV